MKIEKNNIARLKELAKLVCLTILLSACQNDESYSPPPGDPVLIKLNVSSESVLPESNGGSSDDAISSITILQFDATGEGLSDYGNLARVSPGVQGAPGTYTAPVFSSSTTQAKYKLVILANLSTAGIESLDGLAGQTYLQVRQKCISLAYTENLSFGSGSPFPMFGLVDGGKSIKIDANQVYEGIELLRAVARVDIGVGTKALESDTWDKGSIPFTMKEVQIWKAGQKYTCLPANTAYTVNGTSGKITMTKPTLTTDNLLATKTYGPEYIIDQTYCAGKIYLPEAEVWAGGASMYDQNHTNRLALIVGGYYKGSTRETYYRMDFAQGTPPSQTLLNVLRNNVYQFTISNVKDAGYDTPQEAYSSLPQNLDFTTATIDDWKTGVTEKPAAQVGYIMAFGVQNGSIVSGNIVDGQSLTKRTVVEKTTFWEGEGYSEGDETTHITVDYNKFYGEVPGNLQRSVATPNGDIYPDIETLLRVEGVYPLLMVSTDDVYSIDGKAKVNWKDETVYTAFDLCKNYTGSGYEDWRLPRASELLLMYFNRESLESQRGFTNFSGSYWSGSEKGLADDATAEQAWVVNFDMNRIHLNGVAKNIEIESNRNKVRCVRQYKSDSDENKLGK